MVSVVVARASPEALVIYRISKKCKLSSQPASGKSSIRYLLKFERYAARGNEKEYRGAHFSLEWGGRLAMALRQTILLLDGANALSRACHGACMATSSDSIFINKRNAILRLHFEIWLHRRSSLAIIEQISTEYRKEAYEACQWPALSKPENLSSSSKSA